MCQHWTGHYDHVHIELTYEPKNWWTEKDVNEIPAKPTALILNQNILDVKPALSFDPDTGGFIFFYNILGGENCLYLFLKKIK